MINDRDMCIIVQGVRNGQHQIGHHFLIQGIQFVYKIYVTKIQKILLRDKNIQPGYEEMRHQRCRFRGGDTDNHSQKCSDGDKYLLNVINHQHYSSPP